MATFDHSVDLTYPNPDYNAATPAPGTVPDCAVKLGGMGPAVRSIFVQLLKARAWAELDKQAAAMDPLRFKRLEAATMEAMQAGKYEWGDEIHLSIDGGRTANEFGIIARIKSVSPHFKPTHLESVVNVYGWDRLLNFCQQADGPPPKNDPAPQAAGQSNG